MNPKPSPGPTPMPRPQASLKGRTLVITGGSRGIGLEIGKRAQRKLSKIPGIAETIDWALSLMALGFHSIGEKAVEKTLGCVLKSTRDIESIKAEGVAHFIAEANILNR